MLNPKNNETQNEILLAALSLFVRKGYFNTSLTEIALAAQLSQTQEIFLYFESKQQLAAELHATIMDSLSISIDEIRRRNKKASEQLHSLVDLLFKLTDEAPEALRFLFEINVHRIVYNFLNSKKSNE